MANEDAIAKRLHDITTRVLDGADTNQTGMDAEIEMLRAFAKVSKLLDGSTVLDVRIRERLNKLLRQAVKPRGDAEEFNAESYTDELKRIENLIRALDVRGELEVRDSEWEEQRKSDKVWDVRGSGLTTGITLTKKQRQALELLDSGHYQEFLALGGSGSGKSFLMVYRLIRDALRHKAPCLVLRSNLTALQQGVVDQIVPAVLGAIAEANGRGVAAGNPNAWREWAIDGLKFAKWTGLKGTKLEFATGGYIRFGGMLATSRAESGLDKLLSPSWFSILIEECSEVEDYSTVQKVASRLRYVVHKLDAQMVGRRAPTDKERDEFEAALAAKGYTYKVPVRVETREDSRGVEQWWLTADMPRTLMLCENPPSINHWTYKHYFEKRSQAGDNLTADKLKGMYAIQMNAQDNSFLDKQYIDKTLAQFTGADYQRFFLGMFQDMEQGDIFKRIEWVDSLPPHKAWERLVIYTDPTPLTGREYSQWADYKCSVLCGLCDGKTYVIDIRIVKGSTTDMLANMKALWDKSPRQDITDMLMEKRQVPSDFDQIMRSFAQRTGWYIPVKWDTRPMGDKVGAIELFLSPLVEDNLLLFYSGFRNTDRGRELQVQFLKFSRKANKTIHDDIPDAVMRADTFLRGKHRRKSKIAGNPVFSSIRPIYLR